MKTVRICSAFILDAQNRILSVEQFYERLDRQVWTLPGGGVEDDEDPEQGARREVTEETGYRVTGALYPVYHYQVDAPHENIRFDVYGYIGRDYEGAAVISEAEISRVEFLPLDVAMQEMAVIDDEARVKPILHVLALLQKDASDITQLPCYTQRFVIDEHRCIIQAD